MTYLNTRQKRLLKYYMKSISYYLAVDNWNEAEAVLDAARMDEDLPRSSHQFLFVILDAYYSAKGFSDCF